MESKNPANGADALELVEEIGDEIEYRTVALGDSPEDDRAALVVLRRLDASAEEIAREFEGRDLTDDARRALRRIAAAFALVTAR